MTNVSGILPIYNGAKWIPIRLPEILDCLDEEDELIVIDDGSIDDSRQLVNEFASLDSRIRLITQSHLGVVSALNLGIHLSKYNWLARFDIDDSYASFRIKSQMAVTDLEHIGAIFSDYEIWQDGARYEGRMFSPIFALQTKLSLVNSQRTAHPSAIINKHYVELVGLYSESGFPAEDLDLWIRLSNVSKLVSVSDACLRYNRHTFSTSALYRHNAISAKRNFRQRIFFSSEEIKTLLNDFPSLLDQYLNIPNSKPRQLLFIFDYLTWLIKGNLELSKSIRFLKFLATSSRIPLLIFDFEVIELIKSTLRRVLSKKFS